ncbi:MAG: DivIVA domain-containing protein [Acidimicrobiales bacterium]
MGPDPSLTPELIQAQSFTSAFRGLDPGEVRAFLARVAADVKAWRERAEHLESAWRSAEERAARPPVLDEEALIDAVGDETASVLRSARAAASDLRAKAAADAQERLAVAKSESERLLAQATAEADSLIAKAGQDAERMLGEVAARVEQETIQSQQAAARLVADAEVQAAALLDKARVEAATAVAKAREDSELAIQAANVTRDRILDDLARRRRVASVQIEQLRAGRERLIESYALVRRTLDEVQSELARADSEARAAADAVGRRLRSSSEGPEDDTRVFDVDVLAVEADAGTTDGPAVEADAGTTDGPAVEADAGTTDGPAVEADAGTTDGPAVEADATDTASSAAATVDVPGDHGTSEDSAEPGTFEAAGPDRPPSAVDELFARIRANRQDGDDDRSDLRAGVDLRMPAPATDHERGGSVDASQQAVADDAMAVPTDSTDLEGRLSDEEEGLLERRESAIGELEQQLTRALKRSLQDEQNDLLDKLRILSGDLSVERLLGREHAQLRRYRAMVAPALDEAGRRGGAFASQSFGLPAPDGSGGTVLVNVEDLADSCAAGLVGALRRRLEQAIGAESVLGADGNPDERDGLVEAIGSAYREWKSQRIERLVGDALCAAFARGTWTLTPSGEGLRWLVDDLDGACPDCDDDALAGVLSKPEEFPTGQLHPPAHVGCRCMLVPVVVAASRAG